MRKKILIGSIFVLTLLILMPSVSAIHKNSIENEIKQQVDKITPFDLLDFEPPDKFPLAFYFVLTIFYFRIIRLNMLIEYAIEGDYPGDFEIVHPLIVLRCAILLWATAWWFEGWDAISDYFGWGWFEYR